MHNQPMDIYYIYIYGPFIFDVSECLIFMLFILDASSFYHTVGSITYSIQVGSNTTNLSLSDGSYIELEKLNELKDPPTCMAIK